MKNRINRTLYNLTLPVVVGAGYVVSLFHAKLREAARGRKGWRNRWRGAGVSLGKRPVWFHVSSVGEFEQAKPVITALSEVYPNVPVVVSFSSPSGYWYALRRERFDDENNIKFVDYLPVDFPRNVRECLECIDPRLLLFVKFDLWPNLIWEARRRHVPVLLIDATLSPSSPRTTGVGRSFYRSVYSSIQKILAISDSDAARFRQTVPDHPSISVTGDTRFDRVLERKRLAGDIGFDIARNGRKIVVCGSTWPPDEDRLLPALSSLLSDDADLYVIIAPHEPRPERVDALTNWARSAGVTVDVVSGGIKDPPPRVVVVDTVGILAETYRLGDLAFVGGGFSTGVHSVIEPAVESLPVLFGPVHDNSFEALRLIEVGAGFPVGSERDVHDTLKRLLADAAARTGAGQRAREYVESQLGATEKCVAAVAEYL
jgi:3-deoxy-D-manno-octulosonic-acid transferase